MCSIHRRIDGGAELSKTAGHPARKKAAPKKPAGRKAPAKRASPSTLTIALDSTEKIAWFVGTKLGKDKDGAYTSKEAETVAEKLMASKITEAELVGKAVKLSGYPIEEIARIGLRATAKRLIANALTPQGAEAGQGVAGSRDGQLAEAYAALKKAGEKPTPAKLIAGAKLPGRFITAKKWLERNHPQELV